MLCGSVDFDTAYPLGSYRSEVGAELSYEARRPSMQDDVRSQDNVDLRPLSMDGGALEMLLLARGQLNRAFRRHGLLPPDPLPVSHLAEIDIAESDDPAGVGMAQAKARFPEALTLWVAEMPVDLVDPVLSILQQTHDILRSRSDAPGTAEKAVKRAYDYLSGHRVSGVGHHAS